MIIDVTYQCRRKIKQTYPMKEEHIRDKIKNCIVYDKSDLDATFCDKCKTCELGNMGINVKMGTVLTLCNLTRIEEHKE